MTGTAVSNQEVGVGWGRGRRIAFYVAVGLTLASMAITGPALTLPVTAWFPESALEALFGMEGLGAHRVHMEGGSLLFWLTIVAMIAQIRRPEGKATPLWAAVLAWVAFLPMELTHLADPFSIIVTVLVLVVLILQPRRWPKTSIVWRPGPRLIAFPWATLGLIYAYQQASLQINGFPEDAHVAGSHYALMAAVAIGLSASALLGATDLPGRLISVWTTGLMALSLGAFFVGHPDQASSAGAGWGVAIMVWALVYLLVSAGQNRSAVTSRGAEASAGA